MAVYPITAGHPDYSGTFIPTIWSGKLIKKFYDATVLSQISNTDYEGEIKDKGDKVEIRQVPDIIIRDYSKGANLQLQRPEADNVELLIDKGKYFAVILDDVDKVQSDIALMDKFTSDASEQMKIAIDTDVLGTIYSDPSSYNLGATAGRISGNINLGTTGSPVELTKANVLDYIVDCGTILDEQNIPESGRWIVIPAWLAALIKKSDLKDASLTGDGSSVLRNGRLGVIDRFTLYSSNLLSTYSADSATRVLFGHPYACTFASQVVKMETLRAETTFGNIVRGLNVYGFKVIKPEGLGLLYCKKG